MLFPRFLVKYLVSICYKYFMERIVSYTVSKWMTIYGLEGVYETPLRGSNESWEMATKSRPLGGSSDNTRYD